MTDRIGATAKEAAPIAGVILFSRPESVAAQGQKPAGAGDQPAALQIPSSSIKVQSALAQPCNRKSRKSMSRRSGQRGHLVKQSGWWRVRFRLDQPGVEARKLVSVKVAPVSLKLSRPDLERRAAGSSTVRALILERFDRIVLGEGATFREQAKIYLQEAVSRNRRPIKDPTSVRGAIRKWINPIIGDVPLSMVDNLTVKPLVRKLVEGGLDPETVNKYVRYVKQVVKSKLAPNGEPLYPRVWNAEVLDLPVVVYRKQKRPALKSDGVNSLIAAAESDVERFLYVLLAATGLRISEALALEARHFINGGLTIKVEQQVDKDCPQILDYVKTDASYREIDLHPDVAAYLRPFVIGKSGLILHTENNTPYLYGNLAEEWLDPKLAKLGLYEEGLGWHGFSALPKFVAEEAASAGRSSLALDGA